MYKIYDTLSGPHLSPWYKKLIAMKLAFVLSLFCFLQVSGHSLGQSITLKMENASLKDVLSAIQKQTKYDFIFNSSKLNDVKLRYVDFENEDFNEVLEKCLSPAGLTYLVENNIVMIRPDSRKKLQQQYTIRGVVYDDNNLPLEGVTIQLLNSARATATNADGSFEMEVPSEQGRFRITALGFEDTEVMFQSGQDLTIALNATESLLDDVVVVGYGVQKKANLTGAVSQVNADDIALRPSANIAGTLQGLMPGLNIQINTGDPTATPDINVRGFNSINSGAPLVLIDGIEGDITRVNPSDIESVSVLKDAASAAIYGARGAFGVILITTKTGQKGSMKVDYTNNFGWTSPTTRTDFVTDPYVYAKTVDAALYGYNGSSYTKNFNDLDWEALRMVANGEIEPFHEQQADGTYKFFYNTNWYDYLFKKQQASNFHNISVSGGSDKLQGYMSGRVFTRETINNIAPADMDRYNIKANLTFTPNSWLELSNNIQFINEFDEDYGGFRNGYGGIWSTTTWYDLFPYYPNKIDGVPIDIGSSGNGGQGGHAAMEDRNNWRRFVTEEFTNTFRAKVTPLEDLELNMDFSTRFTNEDQTYRFNEFDMLHTDRIVPVTTGINRLSEYRWKDRYKAFNLYGTYQKSLNNNHNFKLLLGYNQEDFNRDRLLARMDDLLIRDLANMSLGTSMHEIDGSAMNWAVQGFFGRFNYDYKNKYLLEVNGRYDGSSRFPSESRWGFFPSVSAGWQMDREEFFEPLRNTISSLKLRTSYGKLGNQTIGVNTFRQLMAVGNSEWLDNGSRIVYAQAPAPLPKVVTWETTQSINLGVDIGLFNNKLLTSFDVYEKKTDGMYLPGQPLPGVFGANEPRENYAALTNRGFELSVGYRDNFDLAGSPLNFSVSANVSNFVGTIVKYDNPNGLMNNSYWEGQRLGEIWGYRVDGQFQSDEEAWAYQQSFENPSVSLARVYNFELNVAQNSEWNRLKAGDIKYIDTNGDGKIDRGDFTLDNHGDLVPIGNAMPQFPFGFNMNANWKNWDIAIAGAGVGKQHWYPTGDIYWGTYQRPYLSFLRKDLIDNAWTPDNPDNTYPQIYRGYVALQSDRSLYEMNDYYLENIAYLRVKNMTVGYTLPQNLTRKINIDRLRIFFSGENLLTWRFGGLTKYIDPEQAGSAVSYSNPGSATARADLRDYPMGKTFSFGVNLSL